MTTVTDERMTTLKEFMARMCGQPNPESQLIAILHKAQELFGYLDTAVLDEIARTMNIPTAHIWGVATFYHYFRLAPRGRHVISVCLGTACYVKGAQDVLDAIKQELKIDIGATTEDKLFSLQEARCLGACGLAPVVMIDDKIYGGLTPHTVIELLRGFRRAAKAAAA